METAARRERIDALAAEPDDFTRRLVALALLTDELADANIVPILVGGMALEIYTSQGYATGDVDLALPQAEAVDKAFAVLGFEKSGRFWIRRDLELYFEAPAPAGLPGETAPRTVLEVEGLEVFVIGLEDLLLDRLRAWVHWKSSEDERWTRPPCRHASGPYRLVLPAISGRGRRGGTSPR